MNKKLGQKGSSNEKKQQQNQGLVWESNPGPPVCEGSIVTTVLCGSQLPTSLSFYLIHVIQEETYIRRIPSEEETKGKPNPNLA